MPRGRERGPEALRDWARFGSLCTEMITVDARRAEDRRGNYPVWATLYDEYVNANRCLSQRHMSTMAGNNDHHREHRIPMFRNLHTVDVLVIAPIIRHSTETR